MNEELYNSLWRIPRHLAANKISPGSLGLRLFEIYLVQSTAVNIVNEARSSLFLFFSAPRIRRGHLRWIFSREDGRQRRGKANERRTPAYDFPAHGSSRHMVPSNYATRLRCPCHYSTNSALGTQEEAREFSKPAARGCYDGLPQRTRDHVRRRPRHRA
jgi:hypothetical protein